jgi:methyl-accepting chemotaxis protein
MTKRERNFRVMAVTCAVATTCAVALECSFFAAETSTAVGVFMRIGALGALFSVLVFAMSGLWAGSFRIDYRQQGLSDDDKILELQKTGKIPLVFFASFDLVSLVFVVSIGLLREWIGIRAEVAVPLTLLCYAWCLLGGSGIYNVTDRIIILFLLGQEMPEYPAALRDRRQQGKTLTIPVFCFLLGLAYAGGLLLALLGKWGNFSAIPPVTILANAIGFVCFLSATLALLKLWSENLGRVFDSVIVQLDQLTSAEKNLGNRIHVCSVDEIASIAGRVNDLTHGLASNINEIKASQAQLAVIGTDLRQNAADSVTSMRSIAGNMRLVNEKSSVQADSVREVSVAVEQIAANIESLDRLISEQATSVTEASASIEEMVGNIGAIGNSMNIMGRQFGELGETARKGTETQEAGHRRIGEIAENSKALHEANSVIASIASQTNLLAMNAAIEAAHAGSAGAGFAVVADEIRKLAENASKNSRKISAVLADVEKGIQSVVETSADSKAAFSLVAEQIGSTDAVVQEIRMAIGEQQDGARQILEALRQMNDITSQVKSASSEMNGGSSTILREVALLKSNSSEIGTAFGEIGSEIGALDRDVAVVSEMADSAQSAIARLDSVVGTFRT